MRGASGQRYGRMRDNNACEMTYDIKDMVERLATEATLGWVNKLKLIRIKIDKTKTTNGEVIGTRPRNV
jgi:hypothetical protein